MQRITALWNRGWMGKAIISAVGLLLVCCVLGALVGRGGRRQQPLAGAPTGPTAPAAQVTEPPAPTNAPRATRAPQPTRAPEPTQTLVPTFTPEPTLTPDPSIDHAGVAPLNKDDCPAKYLIKGNESSMLYHSPGDKGYANTDPERCFATIADAKAAGFSAPEN